MNIKYNFSTIIMTVLVLFLFGCSDISDECSTEHIIPDSGLLNYGDDTYKLWLPPGFENAGNCKKKYPLVISLHGGTTLTNHYYQPCIINDEEEFENYPCLFFAPNNAKNKFGAYGEDEVDNARWIRELIHNIIDDENYQVDVNRIYIVGFSMGAHGTTYMAQDIYDDYGYLTAAIIPADGGRFDYITSSEVRDNLSSWFHYGHYNQESDYLSAKAYYTDSIESMENDSMTYTNWDGNEYTFPRETKTLTKNGIEIFKISAYEGMGHTDGPVYEDPKVLEWLFDQSSNR